LSRGMKGRLAQFFLQTGDSEGDGLTKTINLQIFKPLALHLRV